MDAIGDYPNLTETMRASAGCLCCRRPSLTCPASPSSKRVPAPNVFRRYRIPGADVAVADITGGCRPDLFGTDHPFFPPHVANAGLDSAAWHSPTVHRPIIQQLGPAHATPNLRDNALTIFGLESAPLLEPGNPLLP
jgi:hypothetical protein